MEENANRRRLGGAVGLSLGGLVVLASLAAAQPLPMTESGSGYEVRFAPEAVRVEMGAAGAAASLEGIPGAVLEPGAPSLPRVPVVVEIPVDHSAQSIAASVEEVVVARGLTMAPAPVPRAAGAPPRAVAPIQALFEAPYPAQRALIQGEGLARGHRLVTVTLAPLRWYPEDGELRLATRIRFELDLAPTADRPLQRYRAVPAADWRYDTSLAASIGAPPPPPPRAPIGAEAAPFTPSFPPSIDGSPVVYVIVTSAALAPEFEPLAEWRTRTGLPAVVRTIEWIESYYPNGADRAEQLRFFLQDAYQNWGTLWALLGGDTEILPVRYAASLVQTVPESPHFIPSDLYFACLDGNWNGDGDDRIGEGFVSIAEPGDGADLLPEIFVGRAPVATPEQAATFVQKTIDYERTPPVDAAYPGSILFLAEDLGFADGADIAEGAFAQVHPWMRVVRLYENFEDFPGSLALTKQAAIDSINAGFGWVHHVGHGFRNTMSVGDGTIGNAEADGLTNGGRLPFVFAINCSSASIDFNSIGERWIKNPNGGAAGYVGTTRLAFAAVSERYQNEFYRLAFEDSVATAGECLFMSRLPWVATSFSDNFDRWTQLALILLGDPVLPLWTTTPTALVGSHDASVSLGEGSFTVTALNQNSDPVPNARVTLSAPGEDYKTGLTDASGQVTLPFDPETTAGFAATIVRQHYLPYEAQIAVDAGAGPFLYVSGLTLDDDDFGLSIGNGDGLADAGETLEIGLTLRNSGAGAATGIAGALAVEEGAQHVTVLSGAVTYPDLDPGTSAARTHRIRLAASSPPGFQPRLRIDIASQQDLWSDGFVVPVHTIELEQYSHTWFDPAPGGNGNGVIEPGETLDYSVELRNNGVGAAMAVEATLRVVNRLTGEPDARVTVTDSTATYGDLLPGDRAVGDFSFALDPTATPEDLRLELTPQHIWGAVGVQRSDLTPPGPVDSLWTIGSEDAILVKWTPAPDADLLGYDVFRSGQPSGPFERVNDQTVVGSSFYEDTPLAALTRYYFRVAARDSSFNQGEATATIAATTNPPVHAGWPIEVAQATTSGPKVADLVAGGGLEIVVGADCIHAWHADGTELVDGDGDPRTPGVLTLEGCDALNGFRSDAAIADIDFDGDLEIVIAGWGASLAEGFVHIVGADGAPHPGWPRSLGGTFNWASAAVGQLSPDQHLEIVTMQGQAGIVYAFHADGNEVLDGDDDPATVGPFFSTASSFNYGSPALGDLDGDLLDEIVVVQNTASGRVFAIDGDGSLLPGWPFLTGGQITSSPAIADLDGVAPPEIVTTAEDDSVYVLTADGTPFPGWPRHAEINSVTARSPSPVVVDLDLDGELDVIVVANDGRIHVWDRNGNTLPGWENVLFAQSALGSGASEATPTLGDIDADGQLELLIGGEDGKLYAFNHDATEVLGFPIQLQGEVRSAATIWDIDGDGLVEIAVSGWDQNVHVWDLDVPFDEGLTPWPFFRRDLMNRANPEGPNQIGVGQTAPVAPARYRLGRAHPNPFNPRTRFELDVPASGRGAPVVVRIYDVAGRLQRSLFDAPLPPGHHTFAWDGRDQRGDSLPSGLYFVHAEAPGFEATRKLIMVK